MSNGNRCFLVSFITRKTDGNSYTGMAGAVTQNYKYLNREEFVRKFDPDATNKSLIESTIITQIVEVNPADYTEFFRTEPVVEAEMEVTEASVREVNNSGEEVEKAEES